MAFRVLMVWVYDHTQSLLILVLMHAALTGSNMLFEPEGLAGLSNFIYDFVEIVAMWGVEAIKLRVSGRWMRVSPQPGTIKPA